MKKWRRGFAAAALCAGILSMVASPIGAQRIQVSGAAALAGADTDALERYLFTPELIMRHYREIDLEPAQRETITRAMEQLQVGLVDLQWRLMESTQQLEEALSGSSIDEQRAVALVDQVLAMEREVKTRHLTALIRIKNALTAEQQEQLKRLNGPRGYLNVVPYGLEHLFPDSTMRRDSVGVIRGEVQVAPTVRGRIEGLRLIGLGESESGRVTGRVLDEATGQPLRGAQVMITGSQTGVVTQADGRYLMSTPVGQQTLRAQMIGYGPVEQSVSVAADGTARVDFELSPEAIPGAAARVLPGGIGR